MTRHLTSDDLACLFQERNVVEVVVKSGDNFYVFPTIDDIIHHFSENAPFTSIHDMTYLQGNSIISFNDRNMTIEIISKTKRVYKFFSAKYYYEVKSSLS